MDREKWTDERLDDFVRLVGPSVAVSANNVVEIGILKDATARHEGFVRDAVGRIEQKLEAIDGRVKETNGRLSKVEREQAKEEGAREARAELLEDRRKTLAVKLAKHGWIAPTLAGGGVALAVTVLGKLIS